MNIVQRSSLFIVISLIMYNTFCIALPNVNALELSKLEQGDRDVTAMYNPNEAKIREVENGNRLICTIDVPQTIYLPKDKAYFTEHGKMLKILLSNKDNVLIGQIKIFVLEKSAWSSGKEPYGFIQLLKIEPRFYRQGYGKKLLHEAYQIFKSYGISTVMLNVWGGNFEVARNLYASEGFRPWNGKRYIMVKVLE